MLLRTTSASVYFFLPRRNRGLSGNKVTVRIKLKAAKLRATYARTSH